MTKYWAWALVALVFGGLAHWHGVAPGAKEVRITGQSAWNTVLSKRDRAVFTAKVNRVEADPFEKRTKILLEADDGSPITVYQPPMIYGINWPAYGQRVEVKAQQIGPGMFTLVDHDSVRWNAPRVNDEKLIVQLWGYPESCELLEGGRMQVQLYAEGGPLQVVIVPPDLVAKLNEVRQTGRECHFDGFERANVTWITSIHD